MRSSSFHAVAATVFGIVAVAHAARLLLSVPVQVGATAIPVWVSWPGLAVSAALCAWAIGSRPRD